MSHLVNPNQTAFVKGRSISNNVPLTRELVHNYHKSHVSPCNVVKVDQFKAFDSRKNGSLCLTSSKL